MKIVQQTALLKRLETSSKSKWAECRVELSAVADTQSKEFASLQNSRAEIQTLQVKQSHYLNVVANTKALLQHNGFKHEVSLDGILESTAVKDSGRFVRCKDSLMHVQLWDTSFLHQ